MVALVRLKCSNSKVVRQRKLVIGPRKLHQLVEARGEAFGKAAVVVQQWWRRWLAVKQEATAASEGRLMGALAALVAELQVRVWVIWCARECAMFPVGC